MIDSCPTKLICVKERLNEKRLEGKLNCIRLESEILVPSGS